MKRSAFVVRPLAALAVVSLASVAFARDIRVPRDARSLDDAILKAKAGDRIIVRRGTYDAALPLDVSGVTLIGKRAKIRGGLIVRGDDVTVKGFKFVSGELDMRGENATIVKNRFKSASVVTSGDGATIDRNRVKGFETMISIQASGSNATVSDNRIKDVNCAIVVSGDGSDVVDNDVRNADEAGVVAQADDITVIDNDIRGVNLMDAITVVGNDAVVTGNAAQEAVGGVRVEGDRSVVAENDLDVGFDLTRDGPVGDVGLAVTGCPAITVITSEPGSVVRDNDVTHIAGTGIVVAAQDALIEHNTVVGSNSRTSISVVGDGNTIRGNDVSQDAQDIWFGAPDPDRLDPMDGIGVRGNENVIDTNTVRNAFDDGIDVIGTHNEICNNAIVTTGDEGIDLDGDDNLLENNTVRDAGGVGVDVTGKRNGVSFNTVRDVWQHAVVIDGRDNYTEKNTARDPGADGILVLGSGNLLSGDIISGANGCGVFLDGSNDVDQCAVTDCDMGGVVNLGSGSTLDGSHMTANQPVDVIDIGGFDSFTGNTVGVTSTDGDLLLGGTPTHDEWDDRPPVDPWPMGPFDLGGGLRF